jgi:tryptophanyl-tRNA synthetase
MSKSYNNGIYLRETPESLKQKVQMMITDPQRVRRNDPGDPEVCAVYAYHKIYTPDRLDEIAAGCRDASIGCRDCKNILFERLNTMLEPIRQRRCEIEQRKGYVEEVLAAGEEKAHRIAGETIAEIRAAMGFNL